MERLYSYAGLVSGVAVMNLKLYQTQAAPLKDEPILSFPLADDYPLLVQHDEDGSVKNVLVTYGQDRWDFSSVALQIKNFYFIKVSNLAKGDISLGNWDAFKRAMAYLWITRKKVLSVDTYEYYYKQLRALFVILTELRIEILDAPLSEQQAFAVFYRHKRSDVLLNLMTLLYVGRSSLRFYFLDPWVTVLVQRTIAQRKFSQTPSIPWRIWEYQKDRLYEFLSDFIEASSRLFMLCDYLIEAYEHSDYKAKRISGRVTSDTHNVGPLRGASAGALSFEDLAEEFNLSFLLNKWMVAPGRNLTVIISQDGARIFSSYLNAVCYVGLIYMANFSGMRRRELSRLRANCVVKEQDEVLGDIYFLRSGTSKTIDDPNALWVTNDRSDEVAEALAAISRMRVRCARIFGRGDIEGVDTENPLLAMRAFEPWGRARGEALEKSIYLLKDLSYAEWQVVCPNLFDKKIITITEEDLLVALKYTPGLDLDDYAIGKCWPFALHQLRRTLLIDAIESGVSDESAQYQAKHHVLHVTRYYAANYQPNMSSQMRDSLLEEIAASLVRFAGGLKDNHFVSVYGEAHKSRLIEFLSAADSTQLRKMVGSNTFGLRETFFGVCLKRGSCSSGGISYVADCGSCAEGLGDKRKVSSLNMIKSELIASLTELNEGDLDYTSVCHQIAAIEKSVRFLQGLIDE